MILVISATKETAILSAVIEKEMGQPCHSASASHSATVALKSGEYNAILVDQVFLDVNPAFISAMWRHSGMALPVIVNFAITGTERLVRHLRAALEQKERERLLATRAAEAVLRSELTGAISGILLSSELALAEPALPAIVASKLRSVRELAMRMQSRLQTVA